ncbi:MAG: hypothetical protein WCN98_14695, partial [Verrucomicrobiaceae bacterium]
PRTRGGERKGPKGADAAQLERSVYVLRGEGVTAKPEPVKIKSGISDGIFTEVIEGLNENDPVITGMTGGPQQAVQPTSNPFSRRF